MSCSNPLSVEYPEEKSFHEYFLRKIDDYIDEGRVNSFLDLKNDLMYKFEDFPRLSSLVAKNFVHRGLKKGDTVIYSTQDMGLIYFIILGIWRANGIVRSVYPEETLEHFRKVTKEGNTRWIICDPPLARKLKAFYNGKNDQSSVEIIVFDEIIEGCTSVVELVTEQLMGIELPETQVGLDDTIIILPTSGTTTGDSKGAVHTNKSVLWCCKALEMIPSSYDLTKPTLWFGKTTHTSGILIFLNVICYGQLIIRATYNPDTIFSIIQTYKVETVYILTVLLNHLIDDPKSQDYDLTSLKAINFGGSVVHAGTLLKLKTKFPSLVTVANGYGLTEAVGLCSSLVPNLEKLRIVYEGIPDTSVGKVIPGVSLKVRDVETGDVELGPREPGELLFQSDGILKEYLNNPEATKETIHEDQWLSTGDYGYYDENCFIYVLDRVKDTFAGMSGNHDPTFCNILYQINPSEIEDIVMSHPDVKDCIVIPEPYGAMGDPRAFVTLKPGHRASLDLEENIKKFANDRLADYKHLNGGVFILSQFPLGKSGKALKRELANYKPPT